MGAPALHWQVDSTSSELLRQAAAGAPDLASCLAEVQRAGRGRRGRDWRMPLGGGLALSMLKRFDRGMAALAGLSLVAGIATCEALADAGVADVGLKWPNDLVAADAKLGGILVELGGDALGPCHAVIGIGLNLRLGDAAVAAIDQPCTDLARLCAALPGRNVLAAQVLARLVPALERFGRDGFAPFAASFAALDVLQGRRVGVTRAGDVGGAEGVACGVDARGALRVRFDDGERSIDSGELSVRARA
jgi:BirA family biotin operon repressor/biotin-[acetyl-CoA-carboxylase] ligase